MQAWAQDNGARVDGKVLVSPAGMHVDGVRIVDTCCPGPTKAHRSLKRTPSLKRLCAITFGINALQCPGQASLNVFRDGSFQQNLESAMLMASIEQRRDQICACVISFRAKCVGNRLNTWSSTHTGDSVVTCVPNPEIAFSSANLLNINKCIQFG